MVYIFCALFDEAAGIINKYGLKKQKEDPRLKFDVFTAEGTDITLVLTGTGLMNAAVAAGSACSFYGIGPSDHIVNVGTCAGKEPVGTAVLADRIKNAATGRTFYPDMLLKTGLSERPLVTCTRAITEKEMPESIKDAAETGEDPGHEVTEIFDMEAAGIFEAAVFYTGQHCISIIKAVSDNGISETDDLTKIKEKIDTAMALAAEAVTGYIDLVVAEDREGNRKTAALTDSNEDLYIEKLSSDLKCSVTMEKRLRQIMRYAYLAGTDHRGVIASFYETGILPVKNKNDGKTVLENIAEKLLQS